jgi:hypothetical protein
VTRASQMRKKKGRRFLAAVEEHSFSESVCFLCGARLRDNRSQEHVFPAWLQHRFGLWDQTITLLNGTTIPYRQLTIPCCTRCNTHYLSNLEACVNQAVTTGASAVRAMDQLTLFLWVTKLFYGVLYRELFLPVDRRARRLDPIMRHLEPFELIHHFLQAIRVPTVFRSSDAPFPGSIYVFKVQAPREHRAHFDFRDDIEHQTVFLRLGSIGILAAFDFGAQAVEGRRFFGRYARYSLHPMQFEELGAFFFYKARLFNRRPTVLLAESGPGGRAMVVVPPIAGMSGGPVFGSWNPQHFAEVLSVFTKTPLHTLHPQPTKIMTWLARPDGSWLRMDLRRIQYRGTR